MAADIFQIAIILSPFLLLPIAGWLGGRSVPRASLLALVPAALTGYFVWIWRLVASTGPATVSLSWAPALGLSLDFRFDGLSLLFATLITGVGTLIVLYAARYLAGHIDAGRFQVSLFAFMGSMLGLVLSDNVIALFVFWELTGFTSYLLIGFEHERSGARRAALQALIVTGAGGLALLAAGVMLWHVTGTPSLSAMLTSGSALVHHPLYSTIVALVLLAAFTKSAQFPFHFWLPNAMAAPTPVSAYLHSATMVKAGVYLLARTTPLVGGTPLWTSIITLVGAVTMIGAAYRAVLETDLKRVLAYSTVGALGVLVLLIGVGTREALTASLVYLLAHACYKGALFLVAGTIEHETGTRDVTALGGLGRLMPRTAVGAALAAASMAGIPLLFGFVAKEQLYESVVHAGLPGSWTGVLLTVAIAASALLGAAGLIAGVSPFIGSRTVTPSTHEAPASLWLPPLVLAGIGVVAGIVPFIVDAPVSLAAAAIVRDTVPVRLTLWHGLTPMLLLSAITLLGSLAVFFARAAIRRRAWPRRLQTERAYDRLIAGLDAMSNLAAPRLQSASLRSYVLTIVLTATTIVGAGIVAGHVMPGLTRWTPVAPHEAAVAALIVAGALSAATARSTMTAVLSLGAVGYGVATIYVLFGAPDLAMTQFAVETLTVVIFVLVFHQLRGFGDLSSGLVRTRDALIAASAGTVVATLVLYIGASGTSSRLSSYFAETAPALAHGLNVVNVILVDFRGFDTLGEITVLATVAVGVRALLGLEKGRPS